MKPITQPSEIEGLKLRSLEIREPQDYREDEKGAAFVGEAQFWGAKYEITELKIKLDGDMSAKIIQILGPIIAQSASNAARKLAEDAIQMGNALSSAIGKQLEIAKQEAE